MSIQYDVKHYLGLGALSVAFFVYLYAPLLMVFIYSLNASPITGV
ncbi:hypothetical protein [Ruegeria marina]|uniref:Spermidine/putrescine transport system permease protein n=1 Tax=Ruegeria marina TaxID=639004 RepID=A0A1G6Y673_9RHOB|nr:hypothetical protein [Ruegeria marina]SDD85772.1 hypothetical protein SAMN04488239_11150 [Ruegeria marina]